MKKDRDHQKEVFEWRWQQIRLRKKYMMTPAGFKNQEQMEQEIREWKRDVNRFRQEKIYEHLTDYQCPEEFFAGRKELLALIRERLENRKSGFNPEIWKHGQ